MTCIIDITTAITIISDITNLNINLDDSYQPCVIRQIKDEQLDPVLPKLQLEMNKYKKVMTQLIYDKTKQMIDKLGTISEINRFDEFSKDITIIEDIADDIIQYDPYNMGMYEKSLILTAHKYNYTVFTANVSLIKKVSTLYNDIHIDVILHSARSMFGNKNRLISYSQ